MPDWVATIRLTMELFAAITKHCPKHTLDEGKGKQIAHTSNYMVNA